MGATRPATQKTRQHLPFSTRQDAVKAIQNTAPTETTLTLLTNSSEHQAFVRKLAEIKRPIGVVLVVPRD